VRRVLRKNGPPIDGDVEHAALAGNDFSLDSQLARNGGSQTGCLWLVVSTNAVGYLDCHRHPRMMRPNPGQWSSLQAAN